MIMVMVNFLTYSNFLLFVLLTGLNGVWIYSRLKKKPEFSLAPFILVNVFLFLVWTGTAPIEDETEHLHCAWMVAQGLIPYRDFWQHHSPSVWVLLAPFFKIIKPSAGIFDLSRFVSALFSAANVYIGWLIARKCWKERAGISAYLLVISSAAVFAQLSLIRPDLFMQFFMLAGTYFSLKIPGVKKLPALWAGVAFGLAESFVFKQYLLLLLPVIVIFTENHRLKIIKFLLYVFGLVLGGVPLICYLYSRNIVGDFIFWVLQFNGKRILFSNAFPLAIGAMGMWGAVRLLRRYRATGDFPAYILCLAFCLSTLSSLTGLSPMPATGGGYYLTFWLILCGITGSGCALPEAAGYFKSLRVKSLVLGFMLSLFLFPNFMLNIRRENQTGFAEAKRVIAQLIDYCGQDSCFLIVPFHPVFSKDATRLYLVWQDYFADKLSSVRNDLRGHDLAGQIFSSRPAVIVQRVDSKLISFDLFLKGLISREDFRKLNVFLEENYTVKDIGNEKYYIRNDKLQK